MKINFFTCFICICLINKTYASNDSNYVVKTKHGMLQGVCYKGVYTWRGIPYAKAPIGRLRFKAPQPPEDWEGIKMASQYGPRAPQISKMIDSIGYSEDCLNLNVWSANTKTKKPVMVWIHGGAFYTGAGSLSIYDGSDLVKKGDVVVVSINYRLGALGFLYFDKLKQNKEGFDNNLGIKDQIAALKWVKENIAEFGGDPNNITVFGQSAGATSITMLLKTNEAKGLFNKVIAESPAPKGYWNEDEATRVTKLYLKLLEVDETDLDKLYDIETEKITRVAFDMIKDTANRIPGVGTFAPTIDGIFIKSDFVIRDSISLMLGTNKHEMNMFKKMGSIPFLAKTESIKRLSSKIDEQKSHEFISNYKLQSKSQKITNVITDGVFRIPSIRVADEYSQYAPTYMYRFDWNSLPLLVTGLKSCHALELFFVFNSFDTKTGKRLTKLSNKNTINKLANSVQNAWINFAHNGNPNSVGNDMWKAYNTKDRKTMIFDNKNRLKSDPNKTQRLSWEGITIH